ncbi:hypothetical protein GUITHDRAFT_147645 [Guillardia theta CCMP2712]|uniref:Uncharacterized protein n=1 Tax=Guillardia theta (strain CCMP2712) TaxID=905079 RepID=L1ICR4_GUITC|nr:hypothetical protein GUITHDRAFT_147645 [Guillardia theta CCMP2712]EKX33862.1 hypothetical protein GUITHDRAFT_147645 [Guillardia theta CCMP2712]|eukprot:XP_005820842.1 hypothetical protein GUITHDRAFT_147645 [Guillardia theta CCMP2712]
MSTFSSLWDEVESELIKLRVRVEMHRDQDERDRTKINEDLLYLMYKCKGKLQIACAMINQEQVLAAMHFQKMIMMVLKSIWNARRSKRLLNKQGEQMHLYEYIKTFQMVSYRNYEGELSMMIQQGIDAVVHTAISEDTPGITVRLSQVRESNLKAEVEQLLQHQRELEQCIKTSFCSIGVSIYIDVQRLRTIQSRVAMSKTRIGGCYAFNVTFDCHPVRTGTMCALLDDAEREVVAVVHCLSCIEDNYGISSDVLLWIAKCVLTEERDKTLGAEEENRGAVRVGDESWGQAFLQGTVEAMLCVHPVKGVGPEPVHDSQALVAVRTS